MVDRFAGLTEGLGVKAPVRAYAAANLTLSGLQTVDGVALVAGDRVAVGGQTSSLDNGVYVASSSAWARSADFDGARDVTGGTLVSVTEGTINAGVLLSVNGSGALLPGTDAVTFTVGLIFSADMSAVDVPLTSSTINGTAPYQANDIINGNFKVAQAGTSFAAPADGSYDLDGWQSGNTSAAVFTIAQVAGSSTGKLARRVTVTTADTSIAAGDRVIHQAKIEGYDAVKYLNNTFTIGFWVKSSVTGTHCLAIYNNTSSYVAEYTIDAANTLEYKTVTVTGGTPLLASTTNTYGFIIRWTNLAGSTYQTTAGAWNTGNFNATSNQVNDCATIGNIFELEGVTLNLGTAVANIEPSYEQLLARCQRYYRRLYPGVAGTPFFAAYVSTTTLADGIYHLNPPMRDAPTAIEQSGTATDYAVAFAAVATQCSAVPIFIDATKSHIRVRFTVAAGLTAGQAGFLRADAGSAAGYLAWSSRL